jgi:hypothetical protein
MPLSVTEFEDLLDFHGSKFDRWPDPERSQAEALIAQSLDARRLYRQAQRLDAALDDVAPTLAAVDLSRLASQIRQQVLHTQQLKPERRFAFRLSSWLPEFGWPQLATLAAAASIGIVVGWTSAPTLLQTTETTSSLTVAGVLVQDGLMSTNVP